MPKGRGLNPMVVGRHGGLLKVSESLFLYLGHPPGVNLSLALAKAHKPAVLGQRSVYP